MMAARVLRSIIMAFMRSAFPCTVIVLSMVIMLFGAVMSFLVILSFAVIMPFRVTVEILTLVHNAFFC